MPPTAFSLDSVTIRPFTPADYSALVVLDNVLWPDHKGTVEAMRFDDESRVPPVKWARFVADLPGVGIIGVGRYGQGNDMYHPQKFGVGVSVHPDFRNAGLGTRLYDHVTAVLAPFDPILLRTQGREDKPESLRFIQKRGFAEVMREWESFLPVADFDPAPFASAFERVREAGLIIKTLPELESDAGRDRKLYELDWAVTLDMPSSDILTEPGFDNWRKRTFENPNFLPDAWFVACDGDNYVGLSYLGNSTGDPTVLYQQTTGVLRDYRRKGIALALKLRGVEYAKNAHREKINTWNATTNRAMLSINEAMGFIKKPAWIDFAKDLTASLKGNPE